MPHLTHSVVVWLGVGPVSEGAQGRPVRPGEGALHQEVLEPNPANLTSCGKMIHEKYKVF